MTEKPSNAKDAISAKVIKIDCAGVLFAVRRRQPMMAHDFRRLSDIVGADGDSLCVSETPCVVE